MEYFLHYLQERGGGAWRFHIVACGKCLSAAILANPCQSPRTGQHGDWHGLAKKAAKTDSLWSVCCAMVRATAACFVVVLWLLYDTQDVEYDAPTTPKPSQLLPPPEMWMKWHPVNTNDD